MSSDTASCAYTQDEARAIFFDRVREQVRFWSDLPDKTAQQRCEGLIFSMMALFDGDVTGLPPLDLVLRPFPGEKEWRVAEGQKYFEDGMALNADCQLHELYFEP